MTKTITKSIVLPNGLEFDPDCNTCPRYMQAQDFLNQGSKICICGKTNVGSDGLCATCYITVEETRGYDEEAGY